MHTFGLGTLLFRSTEPGQRSTELKLTSGAVGQVFGIVGNPVSHSRSPALHNAAFAAANLDAVYVPLLVDDMAPFLAAFPSFSGLSVTIPHKARRRTTRLRACVTHLLYVHHE